MDKRLSLSISLLRGLVLSVFVAGFALFDCFESRFPRRRLATHKKQYRSPCLPVSFLSRFRSFSYIPLFLVSLCILIRAFDHVPHSHSVLHPYCFCNCCYWCIALTRNPQQTAYFPGQMPLFTHCWLTAWLRLGLKMTNMFHGQLAGWGRTTKNRGRRQRKNQAARRGRSLEAKQKTEAETVRQQAARGSAIASSPLCFGPTYCLRLPWHVSMSASLSAFYF